MISVSRQRLYIWQRAEQEADASDMTISAYVAVALREKIERDTGEPIREHVKNVSDYIFEGLPLSS